jgi:phage terminase Nu1 subunit (DNA packaging protein)
MQGGDGMEVKKTSNVDSVIVSTNTLANIFEITDRRVRQLVEEGVLEKVKNGRFELIPTVKRYITYLKTKTDSKSETSVEIDYMSEKAKHEKAKREIAELELAEMKGTMHKAEDVEREMNDMLSAFRAKILSMPSKLAPVLIAQNEIAFIENLLQEEVYNALNELAEYDPALFRGDKYIDKQNEVDEDE